MNKYETVILISNKIDEEQRNNAVNQITKLISDNGKITKIDAIGEKKLAYDVREHKKAYYYVIYFESEASFIHELERNYRIADEVIKFLTIKNDD